MTYIQSLVVPALREAPVLFIRSDMDPQELAGAVFAAISDGTYEKCADSSHRLCYCGHQMGIPASLTSAEEWEKEVPEYRFELCMWTFGPNRRKAVPFQDPSVAESLAFILLDRGVSSAVPVLAPDFSRLELKELSVQERVVRISGEMPETPTVFIKSDSGPERILRKMSSLYSDFRRRDTKTGLHTAEPIGPTSTGLYVTEAKWSFAGEYQYELFFWPAAERRRNQKFSKLVISSILDPQISVAYPCEFAESTVTLREYSIHERSLPLKNAILEPREHFDGSR